MQPQNSTCATPVQASSGKQPVDIGRWRARRFEELDRLLKAGVKVRRCAFCGESLSTGEYEHVHHFRNRCPRRMPGQKRFPKFRLKSPRRRAEEGKWRARRKEYLLETGRDELLVAEFGRRARVAR